jgi:transposase InsO family protein
MASTRRRWPSGGSAVQRQLIGLVQQFPSPPSIEQEAVIVAFRKHTLLPLDDCLYALQATIPQLTRSSLHRCLERHGINRLPEVEGEKPRKKKFDIYPIGFFHIDLAEVRTAEGKLYLFVAIDRTSKFAVVELVEKADMQAAAAFLEALVGAVPYRIHTVLTDNGIQFADLPKNRGGLTARWRGHPFDRICLRHGIDHRLTKPNHPWTNGQVERMNRTIKEATVKRFFYDTHEQLKAHLSDFIAAYNFSSATQDPSGPHTLRSHLQTLGPRLRQIYTRPNPPNAGTKHLKTHQEWHYRCF